MTLRERVAAVVGNGKRCGEVAPDLDAVVAAQELVATVTGLADQLYVADPDDGLARSVEPVLRAAVARVFAHPCRHQAA